MNGKRVLIGAALVATIAILYRTLRSSDTDDATDRIDRIDTPGSDAASDQSSGTPASSSGTTQG